MEISRVLKPHNLTVSAKATSSRAKRIVKVLTPCNWRASDAMSSTANYLEWLAKFTSLVKLLCVIKFTTLPYGEFEHV